MSDIVGMGQSVSVEVIRDLNIDWIWVLTLVVYAFIGLELFMIYRRSKNAEAKEDGESDFDRSPDGPLIIHFD